MLKPPKNPLRGTYVQIFFGENLQKMTSKIVIKITTPPPIYVKSGENNAGRYTRDFTVVMNLQGW